MIDRSRIGRRNRNRGSQVEREFKRYAESLGYLAVKSGGGSFGPIDVIAVPTNEAKRIDLPDLVAPDHTLLVQVKSGPMPGPKEREKLLDLEDRCSARVVVALLNPGRRKAGVPRWRFLWPRDLSRLTKEE